MSPKNQSEELQEVILPHISNYLMKLEIYSLIQWKQKQEALIKVDSHLTSLVEDVKNVKAQVSLVYQ